MSILFVCLGNICRSPLAEGIARAVSQERQDARLLDSAGTGDWHIGRPPDQRAQHVACNHGIDISGLRARAVCRDDFFRFRDIVAMDAANLATLLAQKPADAPARVTRLLDWGRAQGDVPDPYYGDMADFEGVYTLLDGGIRHFLAAFDRGDVPSEKEAMP